MTAKKFLPLFKVIKFLVRVFYPEITVEGKENLPSGEFILVGNHAQMHGPIISELFLSDRCYTWCIGEMMDFKSVPDYAFTDFWSRKPAYSRWFFRILSYLIAPLSVVIFNNAKTIGVYKDKRLYSTFKTTVNKLNEGNGIVIFPEHDIERNNIVFDFQDKFIDVARLYYKKTGKNLEFIPMYVAPRLKKVYIGKGITFDCKADIDTQREIICTYIMNEITDIARELPKHTVVPYRNVKKRYYPMNKE